MTSGALLPLAVVIPLAGAALAPLAARISRRAPLVLSVVALGASGGLLLAIAPRVYGGHLVGQFLGHWNPVGGNALGIAFGADPWGLTFALASSLLGMLLAVYTLSELGSLGKRELGGYACQFLLLCGALIGSALTADLFNLFVWFEVAALSSYALTGFFLERPPALEAAFKILVLTTVASFAVFIAAALVYAGNGALNFGQINHALAVHLRPEDLVALGLLIAGFGTKAGLVPFHGWLPDAHTAAPGPVSALFSGLMVNLGIVAIGRVVFQLYTPAVGHHVLGLLMGIGLVSAVGGALFALLQDDLKRLLAYDTISQMGVLTVGLATATDGGVAGAAYHLVDHALFKALLFLCAGAIVHMTGATKLSEMGGFGRRNPMLAVCFVVGVLAIAGVPPLNGYVSLGLIHDALRSGGQGFPFAVMLVAQVLTMASLGKAAYQCFFRRRQPEEPFERDERLRPGMVFALVVLAAGCFAFGVVPGLVLPAIFEPAAGTLLHPALYAHDVLAAGGPLRSVPVSFDYLSPLELVTVLGTVVAAVPVAIIGMRWADASPLTVLRRVQSGSVNDYAGYLVVGLLLAVGVLAAPALAH